MSGQERGLHITEQLMSLPALLFPFPFTDSATRAASVKASFTPRFRFAEHSVSPIVSLHPSLP